MGMDRIASSGMDAAMQEMDVISNNIANQGTAGFKQSSISFSDLYPTSDGSGTQAGMGVDVASVSQNFTAAGSTATGVSTNMAINGSGFFVLKDPTSGQLVYSRNGAFTFDNTQSNYLMLGNQRVEGFAAVNGVVPSGAAATDLAIDTSAVPAVASSSVTQTGLNLDPGDTPPVDSTFSPTDSKSYNTTSSTTIYDSLGNPTTVNMYYVKSSTSNTWTVHSVINNTEITGSPTTMTFDTSGNLTSPSSPVSLSFSPTTGAASPQAFTINFSGATQTGSSYSTGTFTPNGSLPGTFQKITVDNNGNVFAAYSNGTTVLQGQVALANFNNPQALNYLGNAQWTATTDAGAPTISQSNNTNNITSGSLENSNVNVTEQLVDLISAQNAFQANAQAEQTYNQVMQTVTKL